MKKKPTPSYAKNRFVDLQAPVHAKLAEGVNWKHPLLRGADKANQAASLLAAWRADQGYRWFFDRSDIDKMLGAASEQSWQSWQSILGYFQENLWKKSRKQPEQGKWVPVPVDAKGHPTWECFTKKNNEYVCAVNRFHWIPFMAAAARRSGDTANHELLFSLIDNWIKACPVPEDLILTECGVWKYWYKAWAPLNTALRVKHWMFTLHLLWDSPALTPERFGEYVKSLRQHLLFLGRVPPRVDKEAKGNHFLMESEGLLYSSLFPWIKESADARLAALNNFSRCADKQILPDGVHLECSPSYHRGCMQWFGLPLLLCKLNDWKVDESLSERVPTMIDFGLHMINPDGACTKFEDGSASRDNHASEWFLSKMYKRALPVEARAPGGLVVFARNIPNGQPEAPARFPLAVHFPNGGFAAARNSWNADASALIVKLDGYGGGHSHADFLSFSFAWKGRTIIDEQGTYSYNDDRKSVACKLTPSHSVLLLGKREMLTPGKLTYYWDGDRKPCVKITGVHCKPQANGTMGVGARVMWDEKTWWSRHLDFDPQTGLIITDQVECKKSEPVRIQFYLASTNVEVISPTSVITTDFGKPNIKIETKGNPAAKIKITPTEIYEGFFHPVNACLVTIHIPACRSGWWETRITGK
ncbi:MAG: hypothetical protein C0404_06150 [Verrucomicrobia bacterium]|nr:hypothetical protein [Verrucomicrobiota bacterium]